MVGCWVGMENNWGLGGSFGFLGHTRCACVVCALHPTVIITVWWWPLITNPSPASLSLAITDSTQLNSQTCLKKRQTRAHIRYTAVPRAIFECAGVPHDDRAAAPLDSQPRVLSLSPRLTLTMRAVVSAYRPQRSGEAVSATAAALSYKRARAMRQRCPPAALARPGISRPHH